MKKLHAPKNLTEALHSPVTLVTGTALLAVTVLLSYRFIQNAQGEVLLDVAAENLVSMVQIMFA